MGNLNAKQPQISGQSEQTPIGCNWHIDNINEFVTVLSYTDAIDCSPNGKYIAYSQNTIIRIYDPKNRKHVGKNPNSHDSIERLDDRISQIKYSPDGKLIAALTNIEIRVYESKTQDLVGILHGSIASLRSITFSPNGTCIVGGDQQNRIKFLNFKQDLQLSLIGHYDFVSSVDYSLNGEYFVSDSYDKSIVIWNSKRRQLRNRIYGHQDHITLVKMNGQMIVSDSDQCIRIWNGKTCCKQIRILRNHQFSVKLMELTTDSKFILLGWPIRLWNTQTGQVTIQTQIKNQACVVAVSPDGKYIIYDHGYKFIDVTGQKDLEMNYHDKLMSNIQRYVQKQAFFHEKQNKFLWFGSNCCLNN